MTSDELEIDATPCKTVQRPVFRAAIDTPEPRVAEVCEPGAALKPQQSEQPQGEIAVGGRRLSGVPAVGGSLRFAQEVDRHRCPEKGIVFGERIGTDPMLLLWTESVHNISQRPFS